MKYDLLSDNTVSHAAYISQEGKKVAKISKMGMQIRRKQECIILLLLLLVPQIRTEYLKLWKRIMKNKFTGFNHRGEEHHLESFTASLQG